MVTSGFHDDFKAGILPKLNIWPIEKQLDDTFSSHGEHLNLDKSS